MGSFQDRLRKGVQRHHAEGLHWRHLHGGAEGGGRRHLRHVQLPHDQGRVHRQARLQVEDLTSRHFQQSKMPLFACIVLYPMRYYSFFQR